MDRWFFVAEFVPFLRIFSSNGGRVPEKGWAGGFSYLYSLRVSVQPEARSCLLTVTNRLR